MTSDAELLDRYNDTRSEAAFTELVQRYLRLVYSVALRQAGGNTFLAEEITQGVFLLLAKKSHLLRGHPVLAGWLHHATRLVAWRAVRTEQRIKQQEKEVVAMDEQLNDPGTRAGGDGLRPIIDEVIGELEETDRQAILLRFFSDRTFGDIGSALRLSEDAARKRVQRALDKLHAGLSKRGIVSTGAALSLALANQASFGAPAGLAATVAATAFSGAGSAAGVTALGAVTTLMSTLKIPLSVTALIVVTAAAVLITQSRARDRLQAEIASLGQATQSNAQLRQQNKTLAAEAAEVTGLRSDDAELNRLRDEVDAVRARQQEVDRAAAAAQRPRPLVQGPIYDLKNLDQVPKITRQPQPEYPPELKEQGLKGEATVGFIVTEKGEVANAYVISTPRPEFGEAALKAIQQWQFEPGKKAGQAATVRMLQPFAFGVSQPAGQQPLAAPWF